MTRIGGIENPVDDDNLYVNIVEMPISGEWVQLALSREGLLVDDFLLTARQARALADLLHIAANSIDPQPSTVVDL